MRKLFAALFGLIVGTAFCMALVCAAAALGALGGRYSVRLDGLAQFAPFWLAGGAAALLFAAFIRERGIRRLLMGLGLVAVAASAALIAPEFLRPNTPLAAAGSPGQIKIIQFNVWARNRNISSSVEWLAQQNADIIVLEEVTWRFRKAVTERTGYHVTCGRCSVMILSRETPVSKGYKRKSLPGPRPGMTRATFASPYGEYTVIAAHYAWPTADGLQQAQGERLGQLIDRFPRQSLIVAGDFNSAPWSFSRRREDRRFGLERRTRALFTWPARRPDRRRLQFPFPFLPIDHVYAGSAWRTVKVERGPRLGSDHYPVIVTLAPALTR